MIMNSRMDCHINIVNNNININTIHNNDDFTISDSVSNTISSNNSTIDVARVTSCTGVANNITTVSTISDE